MARKIAICGMCDNLTDVEDHALTEQIPEHVEELGRNFYGIGKAAELCAGCKEDVRLAGRTIFETQFAAEAFCPHVLRKLGFEGRGVSTPCPLEKVSDPTLSKDVAGHH